MKALLVVTALATSLGCTHAVNITSTPPGADVYVDGQKVGTTPMTYTESTGSSGQVEITAKQAGREKKVSVPRQTLAPMPIVAGAGAGAAGCLVVNVVFGVAGLILPCCWFGNVAGLALIPAGAAGGWFLYGNQMPDTVTIDMADAAAAGEVAAPPPVTGPPPAASY